MTRSELVATGIVTRCCLTHVGGGRCCDPQDCGPCCPECPDCPTLAAVPTALRKLARREAERRWTQFLVTLRYGPTVWAAVAPRPISTPPQVSVSPIGLPSLVTDTPVPWLSPELP